MCGIIYAKNLMGNEPVNDIVKIVYQNQRDRGQQGFGFLGVRSRSIDVYRAVVEKGIMGYLDGRRYSEVLFHHRTPTSTPNTLKSTHPFVIRLGGRSYYFAHNGIIQNADELQKYHYEMGICYESYEGALFNDSEALAWDFCLWLNNKQDRMRAMGVSAFVCLETDEKNRARRLYFYRNSEAPLRVYKDRTLLLISSEGNYPLVKEDRLYFWDYLSGQVFKAGNLKIDCPSVYDVSMIDDDVPDYPDYEVMLLKELRDLERKRDRLVSIGDYEEAEYIEEEIMDIAYQLKGRHLTQF